MDLTNYYQWREGDKPYGEKQPPLRTKEEKIALVRNLIKRAYEAMYWERDNGMDRALYWGLSYDAVRASYSLQRWWFVLREVK